MDKIFEEYGGILQALVINQMMIAVFMAILIKVTVK